MVRMRSSIPSPNIAITVELDGGIRNPACQDDLDETCCTYSERQNCQASISVPTNKSTELLTVQSTEKLEVGPGIADTVDTMATSAGSQTASEKIMNACRSFWNWRFLVNAVITIAIALFLAVVELGILPHRQIGFFCDDPTISFPYTGETISTSVIVGGTVILPLIVMWLAEWTCHEADSYRSIRPGCAGTRGQQIWTWYGHYTIGMVSMLSVCEVVKIIVGSPRPHFLETCRPLELINCTDSYLQTYTCSNKDLPHWFVVDASKSFPSGHASLSTFTSTYLLCYLQNRFSRRTTTVLLKPWVQCVVLCWAVVCSFTRLSDHRHHWWDVLAGILMGLVTAIYCVKVNCKGFVLKDVGAAGWVHGEPVENGNHGYDSRRHQSVRKLLSNTSVENREMGDVVTTWKE